MHNTQNKPHETNTFFFFYKYCSKSSFQWSIFSAFKPVSCIPKRIIAKNSNRETVTIPYVFQINCLEHIWRNMATEQNKKVLLKLWSETFEIAFKIGYYYCCLGSVGIVTAEMCVYSVVTTQYSINIIFSCCVFFFVNVLIDYGVVCKFTIF